MIKYPKQDQGYGGDDDLQFSSDYCTGAKEDKGNLCAGIQDYYIQVFNYDENNNNADEEDNYAIRFMTYEEDNDVLGL